MSTWVWILIVVLVVAVFVEYWWLKRLSDLHRWVWNDLYRKYVMVYGEVLNRGPGSPSSPAPPPPTFD